MHTFIPFSIGISAAIAGTLLPGILNATTVQIATKEGKKKAYQFMAGALLIIFLQAYLAIFFAKIIDKSPFISNIIQEIGLAIFTGLTIFFLIQNKRNKLKSPHLSKKKSNKFLTGILLALLNVFPVPFYVFVSISAAKFDLFIFQPSHNLALSLGVVLGTFLTFRFYIHLFKNKSIENNFILKNINIIIAVITGSIAVITFCKLVPKII